MKNLSLCLIVLVLLSCNQKFRSSLCSSYLKNIPDDFVGTYKFNISFVGNQDFETSGGDENYIYLTKLAAFSNRVNIGSGSASETRFCEYGSDILIESISSEGFYSYTLVKNTHDGLYMSPLVLKGKTNLNLIPIPKVKEWKDHEWYKGVMINIFKDNIVDNKELEPSDVTPFLTTSSLNFFYERVKLKNQSSVTWHKIK